MKTLLHIGPQGTQCWQKSKAGWQFQKDVPQGPVWAVTDLAEEGFAEIQIPRIFGRDRRDYIRRQLAHQFPDTPFRAAIAWAGGSFMDRLAPQSQLLVGVDAAERIQAALDAQHAALAGLWSTSLLLALLGRHPQLPPELFVVMPGNGGLRIVFLKDRHPVLTRLAPSSDLPTEQAGEIARTLRHLENTRAVAPSERRCAVLALGETAGLAAALAAQRLELVAPPAPWQSAAPPDWQLALFDLALKSPRGQLAPLQQRSAFLGQRLNRTACGGAALVFGVTLWAVSSQLQGAVDAQRKRDQTLTQLQQRHGELAQTEQGIKRWGVTPEVLRLAVNLDAQEVAMAPAIGDAMASIAGIVSDNAPMRVRRFDWHLLSGSDLACASASAAGLFGSVPAAKTEAASELAPKVELKLELALDGDATPQANARLLSKISQALSRLPEAKLLLDPARDHAMQALSSDSATQAATWCLTLAQGRSTPQAARPHP